MKSANLPIYQTWGIKDKESTQLLQSATPVRLFSLSLKSSESSNTLLLLQK